MRRYLGIILILVSMLIVSCDDTTGTSTGDSGYFYRIGQITVEGTTYRAEVDQDKLFTMNDEYGLMVFDSMDSHELDLLGYYTNVASDFAISEDYAYIAGDGIEVVDLTRFDNIEHIYSFSGTNAMDVIVRNDYAYVADADFGLRILDISDPFYIFEVSSYFWGFETTQIEMKWPYILGIYDSGMWIMRVGDSQEIDLVADFGIFDSNALDVYGNYVFIAGDTRVTVLDINDVAHPQEVGIYSFFSPAYDVVATSSKLFVATGWNGVTALDISEPSEPAFIDTYLTTGFAWALDIDFDIIYVACSDGISILRFWYY